MIRYSEPQTIRMYNNREVLLVNSIGTFGVPSPKLIHLKGDKKRFLIPAFDNDVVGLTAVFPDISGYEHIRQCARKSGARVAVCVSDRFYNTTKGAVITCMFGIKNWTTLKSGRIDYELDPDTPVLVMSPSLSELANRTMGIVYLKPDLTIKTAYTVWPTLRDNGSPDKYLIRDVKRSDKQPTYLITNPVLPEKTTKRGVPGELMGYHESYRGIFFKDTDVSDKVQAYLEDTQDTLDSDTFEFFWEML